MKSGKQLRWSLLVFLFLVVIGCLQAEAVNPFAADEKVTIQQGSSLDSGEALFSKPQLDKKAADDSLKNASIAVMSDLHARNWNHASLISAFKAINGLKDVSALVLTGDSVEKIGSPSEYSYLLKTLNTLKKPVWAVTGNHDIMYKDYYNPDKNAKNPKLRTTPAERKAKLERFRKLLKLKATRYTKKIGGHLLVFLPNDALDAKCLVRLSDATLEFLQKTLKENRDMPTIIFCHGPLLGSYVRKGGLPLQQATAQPAAKIRKILKKNPQAFLWVSGHIHMGPSSSNFSAKVNKVDHITNIHVPAVQDSAAWMRIIKLSPEKAVVRTFNGKTGKYAKKHDRTFKHKVKKEPQEKPEKEPKNEPKDEPKDTPPADSDGEDQKQAETNDVPGEIFVDPVDAGESLPDDDLIADQDEEDSEGPEEDETYEEADSQTVVEETEESEESDADTEGAGSEVSDASDTSSATASEAVIEKIRELVAAAMEYINRIFSDFLRFVQP